MKFLINVGRMVLLMFYVMGSIGGIGWSLYNRGYVIAIAVAVLAVMAWPTALRIFEAWREDC